MLTPCKGSHVLRHGSYWLLDRTNQAAGGLQFRGLVSITDGGQTCDRLNLLLGRSSLRLPDSYRAIPSNFYGRVEPLKKKNILALHLTALLPTFLSGHQFGFILAAPSPQPRLPVWMNSRSQALIIFS